MVHDTLINESDGERIPLDKRTDEKDLGIILWCTSTLSPSLQCHKVTFKAMRTLGLMERTFKYISQQSLPFLCKTYVHPHLEYCIPVSPWIAIAFHSGHLT